MLLQVFEPGFTEEDVEAVSSVLRSGYVNEHRLTKEFEQEFAGLVGSKYAVATTSGTMALFMALKAANVNLGSRVAVPDFTAIGTIRAIQLTGAYSILVDVDDEGNIDVDKAKASNVSHVVAVHNNGHPCDIEELISHFGRQSVIEDACQSIGSHYNVDKPLGSISGMGCFSLATTKILTSGQGGVVVTDEYDTYEYLQRMKNQGNFRGIDSPDTYLGEGYNLKWTELNAALALSQMKRLPQRIRRVREIVGAYNTEGIHKLPPLGVLPWRITVKVPANKRDKVIENMREQGVNVQPFPKPIHIHYPVGEEYPYAERYASEGIYLPSSFTLTDEDVQYVCNIFKEASK
jgi:perosamine synthetase